MRSQGCAHFSCPRNRFHCRKRFTKVGYFIGAFGAVFQMQFRDAAVQSIKLVVNKRLNRSWIEMVGFFAFLRQQMVAKRLHRDRLALSGYYSSSASLTTENVVVNYSAVANSQ